MKKVFLDFGGNKGQGLRDFIKRYNIDGESWIVETFEPNPQCEIEKNISDLDFVKINNRHDWGANYIGPYDAKMTYDALIRAQGIDTVAPKSWHFGKDAHRFWSRFMLQYCIANKLI